MTPPPGPKQDVPVAINDFFESLRVVSKSKFFKALEDEDDFSPFPQEDEIDDDDMKSLEFNFNEHSNLKPQLEDILKMLSCCGSDGDDGDVSSVSFKMNSADKDWIINNLQQAQYDVENIQGQLSELMDKGILGSKLESHSNILHKLSISAVADLLPKDVRDVLEVGKPQFQEITELSEQRKKAKSPKKEDTKLPPISDLKVGEEFSQKPVDKPTHKKPKAKQKKHTQTHPTPKQNNQHLPKYLPYEPDECILCEYYHVFGKYPINLMKAYDKRLKEETAMKNNMDNYGRRKKHHQQRKK